MILLTVSSLDIETPKPLTEKIPSETVKGFLPQNLLGSLSNYFVPYKLSKQN